MDTSPSHCHGLDTADSDNVMFLLAVRSSFTYKSMCRMDVKLLPKLQVEHGSHGCFAGHGGHVMSPRGLGDTSMCASTRAELSLANGQCLESGGLLDSLDESSQGSQRPERNPTSYCHTGLNDW